MAVMLRLCLALFFAFIIFIFGVLVAHYRVFPYHHIKSLIASPEYYEDQNTVNYFWRKVSHHQQWAGSQFDLLLVGDSLTNEGEWEQFASGLRVANMGINADTTSGVLKRIEALTAVKAPAVFLLIGINDLLQGQKQDQIIERYKQIVEHLSSHFETVYVQSCLFVGPKYQSYTAEIVALNNSLQAIATLSEGVEYLELNPTLSVGKQLNPAFTNDDLHLNGLGYQAWWNFIVQNLRTSLVPKY